jgi:hypothetical protein
MKKGTGTILNPFFVAEIYKVPVPVFFFHYLSFSGNKLACIQIPVPYL